ncbi:MAG: ATP-binding protein [Clostridia bacterium]|nr:ATP-binding protein [Clostridia bacterium]
MAYNKQIFKKASDIVAQRRRDALAQCEIRRNDCVLRFPEIAELEKDMASSALAVTKALDMADGAKEYVESLKNKNLSSQRKIAEILESNGYGADYLKPRFFCKKCEDKGVVDGVICDCLKDCMRAVALNEISDKIPVKEYTFDNFSLSYYPGEKDAAMSFAPRDKMQGVLNYCKNYAADFGKHSESLIFSGETGLGKTHLSLAIAGEVTKKGFNVIYGSAQNLLNMLEDEKFGRSRLDYSVEESLLGCDLLIIDDLGSEFSTQFTLSAVYNVINSRLLERKPVIISTNYSIDEMESKYSPRITSRIFGNYRHLLFFGKDIRQLKSQY